MSGRISVSIAAPEIIRTTEQRTAVIRLKIPGKDMPKYMDPAIQELLKVLKEQGLHPVGPMFSYHLRRPSDTFEFELGFPVDGEVVGQGRVIPSVLPAERVARTVYQGPYEGLAVAWPRLSGWVETNGHRSAERFWERYLNNPEEVSDPGLYRTELNWVLENASTGEQ